jgi:hypothetical protein
MAMGFVGLVVGIRVFFSFEWFKGRQSCFYSFVEVNIEE